MGLTGHNSMIFNNNNDSKQEEWTLEKSIQRRDKAEIERVELHLHTRYSTMDALTDPSAAVARAAS